MPNGGNPLRSPCVPAGVTRMLPIALAEPTECRIDDVRMSTETVAQRRPLADGSEMAIEAQAVLRTGVGCPEGPDSFTARIYGLLRPAPAVRGASAVPIGPNLFCNPRRRRSSIARRSSEGWAPGRPSGRWHLSRGSGTPFRDVCRPIRPTQFGPGSRSVRRSQILVPNRLMHIVRGLLLVSIKSLRVSRGLQHTEIKEKKAD